MGITPLTETEANALFDILVENAGHNDDANGHRRAEFVQQFTDPTEYRGEYWFSGKFHDFKLISQFRGGDYYWSLIKQTQPARKSPAAHALETTNAALVKAYTTGALRPQYWTFAA